MNGFEFRMMRTRGPVVLLLAFAGHGLAAGAPQATKDMRIEPVIESQATAFDGAYCSFEIQGKPGTVLVHDSEFAWVRIDGQQHKLKADPPGPARSGGDKVVAVFRAGPVSLTAGYRETGRGEGGFSAKGSLLVRKGDSTRQLRIEGGCAD